jgi:D-alanyl-D-alanine carboxypeptidase (penicillin-binding protein 5/6)
MRIVLSYLKSLRVDQHLSLLILSGLMLWLPLNRPTNAIIAAENLIRVYQINTAPVPIKKSESYLSNLAPIIASGSATRESSWSPDQLTASAAAVIDLSSGAILFEKNSKELVFPASTTKLMTALIVKDNYNLDQVISLVEVPRIDGASIGLQPNEQLTIKDLLKATLIQSGNETALILAQNYPGGTASFVNAMNRKAVELHLFDTHFSNVMGFDQAGHYSSARDLALLSRYFMQDELLREIVSTKTTSIGDVRGWYKHQIWNTHQLLNPAEGIIGVKTGTTEGAGEVLITQVDRNGRQLLFVVLGSKDRYQETKNLISWSENSFVWVENLDQIE